MKENQLIHGDSLEILKSFSDNSIDAVITDPPYGIKLDKWDIKIDIETFTREVKRLLKDGFYCFFGQMPTVIDWINYAHKQLTYREQIVWVKRQSTPSYNLSRSFENIYIYTKERKKFYKTKGYYEDVKLPCIETLVASIHGLDRYIKSLWHQIKTGSPEIIGQTQSLDVYKRLRFSSERSPRTVNYTNVWSFLTPNFAKKDGLENKMHPTRKPLEVIKRLIELTTNEGDLVLDPFCGSGTTAIACLELGRKYICIEKDKEYYEIAKERIAKWHNEKKDGNPEYELPKEIDRIVVDQNNQLKLF